MPTMISGPILAGITTSDTQYEDTHQSSRTKLSEEVLQ